MKFHTYNCSGFFVAEINYPIKMVGLMKPLVDANRECINWCDEVFDKDVWDYSVPSAMTLRFQFNREEDRTWFILRWS